MPHLSTGLCAVCGKTTTHRCGCCAEVGTDVLLVWFAHKQFCGAKKVKDDEVPTVLKHFEHGAEPAYSSSLASAGAAVARGILCNLRRAETKGDRDKGILRFEHYPSEYLDSLYIASYAATNGACAASDSGNTVSLEPFEDSNNIYSPFHNLLILYGALFRRFHQQTSMTLGSVVTSPIDKYTLQLSNQIGHYAFFAGMKDMKGGIRMTFASQALPTTGCKLAVTQVSEEEYQRLKKETAAAAGRTV